MEPKFGQIKVYAPSHEITDSGDQLTLTYDMNFDGADFSEEYLNSQYPKEYPNDPEEALGEWQNEFEKVTLYRYFQDKVTEFLNVDEIPGYVSHEVDVSLVGDDPKDMNGSIEVKIWIDIETNKITESVNLFFESTRK